MLCHFKVTAKNFQGICLLYFVRGFPKNDNLTRITRCSSTYFLSVSLDNTQIPTGIWVPFPLLSALKNSLYLKCKYLPDQHSFLYFLS